MVLVGYSGGAYPVDFHHCERDWAHEIPRGVRLGRERLSDMSPPSRRHRTYRQDSRTSHSCQ